LNISRFLYYTIFRFPWWYTLFWSSLLVVICFGLSICYFRFHLIPVTLCPVAPMAWIWHGFILLFEIYDIDAKTDCKLNPTEFKSTFIVCTWPPGPFWWVLLRDGLCLIHVICLGLVVRTCPTRFSGVSAPFNGRPPNSPVRMNLRRHQPRSQRRTRRRRRSSFVIHYILIRKGQIRRRRRR